MTEQIIIAVCGIMSVWLSQSPKDAHRRFACLFGLFAQPFWFWATWKAQQCGIVLLTFVYAAAWARGCYHYWLKPWLVARIDGA